MSVESIFSRLVHFSVRRPRVVLLATAAALAISVWGVLTQLPVRTSNLDLIDQTLPEVRKFLDFSAEFGTPNVLVVTLEGKSRPALEAAVDLVGPQLRAMPGVRSVIDRIPYNRQVLKDAGADPYLASTDGGLFMIFVQPSDLRSRADTIAPLMDETKRILGDAHLDSLGIKGGLTGVPVYAIDDRDVIKRDITRLSYLAFVLVAVLFVVSFRSVRRPLLAMVALSVGVLLAAGFIVIYPGHITLLSAFFASTLFGLGIDYGIHVINRVEELMGEGMSERDAVPRAVTIQARELFTACVTTAFGFFSMCLSGFRGFEELGIIAGVGVLLCLLAMITVLPALLVTFPGRWRNPRPFSRRKLGRILVFIQRPWLAAALTAAVLGGVFLGGPGFDRDYLNLEPRDSEAVRLEREIAARTGFSTQFAVFVAGDAARAKAIAERAMDDETVGEVRSIADLDMLRDASPDHAPFPAYFTAGFVSTGGLYAVYAYPRGNIWDPQRQDAFIRHLRAIDPGVTGMPFLGSFMVARSQQALYVTAGLSIVLLLLAVWHDLRRPLPVLLAATPTFLTVLALRALMRVFDVPLNPLNVMALPIVIGVAVDNGVYLVHRFMDEKGDLPATLAGTGRSVLMTSTTTIAGFGALIFTAHRGLSSFAIALTLGVGAALTLSLLVLPELLRLAGPRLMARSTTPSMEPPP